MIEKRGHWSGVLFATSVALFAVLLGTVVAVGQSVKNPGILIEATDVGSECLDPAYNCCGEEIQITTALYDPLLHETPTGELIPWLATEVPTVENGLIQDDGRTYILPIRKGVRFHNGDELTPEDVEYSFERMMVMDVPGGFGFVYTLPFLGVDSTRDENGNLQVSFEEIDRSVEVQGDCVVFHLANPVPWFLHILADPPFIVDKSWTIAQGSWPGTEETWLEYNMRALEDMPLCKIANGTGPFKLVRFEPETVVELVRNDDYWAGPAKLERVIRKVVPEWSTRLMMLQNGDADIVSVPREYLDQVRGLEGVRVITGIPDARISAIYFNQRIAPESKFIGSGELDGNGIPPDFFSHVTVRKAFCYSFDWDTMINDIFKGMVKKATGPIPSSLPYYNPDQETYYYDPEIAAQLFQQAYDGKLWERGFKFTAVVYTEGDKRIIDLLRYSLKQINPKFEIECVVEPWSALWAHQVQGWLPLFVSGWGADYPDPHTMVHNFMYSRGPDAATQGINKYDELVEAGRSTMDPEKRREIYYELQRLAYEDAIDIWLYESTGWVVMRDWVQGDWRYPFWSAELTYYYGVWK